MSEIVRLENLLGRYISIRDRSELEVRRYLQRKLHDGEDENIIDVLVEKYKRLGYIDDSRTAASFVHSLISSKAKGQAYIKAKLSSLGISKEDISNALREVSEEDLFAAMEKRLQKAKGRIAKQPSNLQRAKTYQVLFSSGFSSSEISRFLDETAKKR
ncbi:MAG TPA: RecX family transcriptional regulator [Patescibacteria group bacterium]|nr:RecX family transcriptional regulator [Patescibacteria group bacterium]